MLRLPCGKQVPETELFWESKKGASDGKVAGKTHHELKFKFHYIGREMEEHRFLFEERIFLSIGMPPNFIDFTATVG